MTEQENSSGTDSSATCTPFTNRRQKNLQKYRRHIASQQKHTADVKESSSNDHFDDPKSDEASRKVKNEEEPAVEPARECEHQATKPEAVTGNDAAKPEKDAPKQQLPLSPLPNEGVPSPMVSPEQASNSTKETVMSPQTSKRRHDILKKLNKKSRHALTGMSPRKEDEVRQSNYLEDGQQPPLLPIMSDPTNKSSNNKAEPTGIHHIQSSAEQRKTETIDSIVDRKAIGTSTRDALSSESVDSKETEETESQEEAGKATNNDVTTNVVPETRDTFTTHLESIDGNESPCLESYRTQVNNNPTEEHNLGVASDSLERANDLRPNVVSQPGPPETGENQVSGDQSCEPSSSFDLRSIHEFPPKPIEEANAALPSRDPSWDTAKVLFSEFQRPASAKSNNDTINVFDTSDPAQWAANDTKAFSESFEPGFHSFADENKDLNLSTFDVDVHTLSQKAEFESRKSPSCEQSPRHRLSRLQLNSPVHSFGFDVSKLIVDSTDELDKLLKQSDEGDESNPEDDANLLVENDQMEEDGDGPVWINDSQPTKEERLQQYTTTTAGENDSDASSSNEEEDDESSIFSQEQEEVAYMAQTEEKKEDDEDARSRTGVDNMPAQIVNEAPAFVLAAEAAISADTHLMDSEDAMRMLTLDVTLKPFSASELPVEATTSEAEQRTGTNESVSASSSEESNSHDGIAPLGSAYISKSSSSGSSNVSTSNITEVTKSSSENGADFSEGNPSGKTNQEGVSEVFDLEESTSLVGVSLVPSFGAAAKCTAKSPSSGQSRIRDGVPPRGSLGSSTLSAPPPPPPLSKRKKKKKKKQKDSSKDVPKIAPPPEDKLQKWLESKDKSMHLNTSRSRESTPKASNLEIIGFGSSPPVKPPPVQELSCGAFEEKDFFEPESPGRIHISCGDYAGADGSWAAATGFQALKDPYQLECSKFAREQLQSTPRDGESGENAFNISCGDYGGADGSWAAVTAFQAQKDPYKMGCSTFAREQLQSTPRVLGKSGENACVSGFSDALVMAGLKGAPSKAAQGSQVGPMQSPVDAARSIALENAMRRANMGLSSRFGFGGETDMRSLFEIEEVPSTGIGCSTSAEEIRSVPKVETAESSTVEEPPKVMRKGLNSAMAVNCGQPPGK
jgi:hypothetical protein